MRSTIIFNGKSSDDFGLVVEYFPESVHAARRGELAPIPGRNGVIVREDGSFDSYVQTYQIWFRKTNENPRDTYANARAVAEWLLNARGFLRLEDSYEPEFFRLARYSGSLNVETVLRNHGRATIQFDVQPQRYLKSGESEIKTGISANDSKYIEIYPLPYSAKKISVRVITPLGTVRAGVSAGFYLDGALYYITLNKQEDTENETVFYGKRAVVEGSKLKVDIGFGGDYYQTEVYSVDENENEVIIASFGTDSPTIYNPTQFEARPLLKFVDVSEEPAPVAQTFTKTYGKAIGNDGTIVQGSHLNYISNKVDTSGFAYAIVTGLGYSFFDSSNRCLSFYSGAPISETKVIIPQNAVSVIIDGSESHEAELLLKAPRPNPGASAATINGTTISLDFSVHDTIYLDCDLHDAYYIDGSSANDKVTFSSNIDPYPTFPGFVPGENTVIVRDGDNLDFSIVPRWWTV